MGYKSFALTEAKVDGKWTFLPPYIEFQDESLSAMDNVREFTLCDNRVFEPCLEENGLAVGLPDDLSPEVAEALADVDGDAIQKTWFTPTELLQLEPDDNMTVGEARRLTQIASYLQIEAFCPGVTDIRIIHYFLN